MKLNKLIILALMLMITLVSAWGLTIVENFGSLPNPLDWTYTNTSECQRTIVNGTLLINGSNTASCYYVLNTNLNSSQDISVEWSMKSNSAGITGATGYGGLSLSEKHTPTEYLSLVNLCRFVVTTFEIGATDKWLGTYATNTTHGFFTQTPVHYTDGTWYDFKFNWDASENQIKYYVDSALIDTQNISASVCENLTNVSVTFGSQSATSLRSYTYYDSIIISATASGGEATCTGLCAINETFDYADSICNHGWTAGDCTDLKLPVNNRYVCNDSDETIAYFFPYMSATSGILTIQYELDHNSDYDILFRVGDQSQTEPFYFTYDNGTIYKEQTSTSIGTYTMGTPTDYKILINLQSQTYDLYIDGTATTTNKGFITPVSHLVYLAFQPDQVKGSPYCDYILDNVAITRGLSVVSAVTLGGNSSLGRCILGANSTNATFNYDCCKENENPQFCVIRVGFEEVTGGFSSYFFDNFILFLVLIVIILTIVFVNKGNSDGMTIINRK